MPESPIAAATVIFLAAILTNNILLSKFLGMCSFIAISRTMKTAWGMGVAVTFVTVCTAVINYFIYYGVLISAEDAAKLGRAAPLIPADLTYLRFLIFIMLIAGFVQLVEMVIERFSPVLYYNLGIFLPLITVNCAILGVSELMINPDYKFGLLRTTAYALGSGLGYLLAICLMAGLRVRLAKAPVPKALRGLGIAVIITGLMAMAFMGFTGVVDLG